LTVVLFSLLLFSGIGSMLTEKIIPSGRGLVMLSSLVVLLVVVVAHGFVVPDIIRAAAGATTTTRIAVAVATLAPLGFALGMPFALGMRAAAASPTHEPTAFFWAVNGAASVCASVFGVAIALFFGITAAFWAGAAAYAGAAASMALIQHHQRPPSPASRQRTATTCRTEHSPVRPASVR
jgi:hypothetical protein